MRVLGAYFLYGCGALFWCSVLALCLGASFVAAESGSVGTSGPQKECTALLKGSVFLKKLPHRALAFDKIGPEDIYAPLDATIKKATADVKAIAESREAPSFKNTVEALEHVDADMTRVYGAMDVLSIHKMSPAQTKLEKHFVPKMVEFSSKILSNKKLFARIKHVYEQHAYNNTPRGLSVEQKRLLNETYNKFAKNGAGLSENKQKRFRKISQELGVLSIQFKENVRQSIADFNLYLSEGEIAGLPEDLKAAARKKAQVAGSKDKYIIGIDYSDYMQAMKYLDSSEARRKLWDAKGKVASQGLFDNSKIVARILELRNQKAKLLGYASHAPRAMEERMAKTPQRVWEFLQTLYDAILPYAEKEWQELQAFAKAQGYKGSLQAWDITYYHTKLKERQQGFDVKLLRNYLNVGSTLKALFKVAKRLYGLEFKLKPHAAYPVWDKEMQVYEVSRKGDFVGLLYLDLFSRPQEKKEGAWMHDFLTQGQWKRRLQRPHVLVATNFTPQEELAFKDRLIEWYDVYVLFHEFGHALHGLLAQGRYRSLSGTNVALDLVELPSQVLENWIYEPEVAQLLGRHYKSKKPLPEAWIKKIRANKNLDTSPMQKLRQVRMSMLDMAWHDGPYQPKSWKDLDVIGFEKEFLAKFPGVVPQHPAAKKHSTTLSFSHLFSSMYDAGYYSYLWSEMLVAGAWPVFERGGFLSRKMGRRFEECILSKGNTREAEVLFADFCPHQPTAQDLVRFWEFKD